MASFGPAGLLLFGFLAGMGGLMSVFAVHSVIRGKARLQRFER